MKITNVRAYVLEAPLSQPFGEAGIIRQAKPAELVENVTYTGFDLSAVMFPQYVLAGVRGCQ